MKNMVELDFKSAHKFVSSRKRDGFFWDGYTIVKWTPGHNGWSETNGMYRKGKWGFANKYKLRDNGTWLVPSKYVSNT
jgi:hypothetical protein